MTMQGARMVGEQQLLVNDRTEAGWSQDEDPEHFNEGLLKEEDTHIDLSKFNDPGPGWRVPGEEPTGPDSIEGAEPFLDSAEFSEALEDVNFRADLRRACQAVFQRYSQSTHASWEDLQQEVLMRFGRWLPRYRKQANRRTVLTRIATNILIDAHRSEKSGKREHEEIDLDVFEVTMVAEKSGPGIEDRIFLKECRRILTAEERTVFDEIFIYGKSLRQLAATHGVSPTAMSKRWARIMTKLHAR